METERWDLSNGQAMGVTRGGIRQFLCEVREVLHLAEKLGYAPHMG